MTLQSFKTSTPSRRRSGWSRSTRCSGSRRRARALSARAPDRPHAPLRRLSAVQAQHRLRQHHSDRAQEREYPGDRALERRIEAYIRWNAMAMVVQANRKSPPNTAATSPATPPRRRCTRSASIISGVRPRDAASRRHGVHPGPFLARHLRARLSGRPAERGAAAAFPPGGRAARACPPIRIRG